MLSLHTLPTKEILTKFETDGPFILYILCVQFGLTHLWMPTDGGARRTAGTIAPVDIATADFEDLYSPERSVPVA